MASWIKRSIKAISERGGLLFVFIRAQFSSQISSLTDFSITILLANVFGVYYVYATLLGSICGGMVNCTINYKWTFKSKGVDVKHVAIKYAIVWIGSILFNTSGTFLVTELLKKVSWLESTLGATLYANVFLISKVLVSLVVGFVWNFNMQRLFVYKDVNIKSLLPGNKKEIPVVEEKEEKTVD